MKTTASSALALKAILAAAFLAAPAALAQNLLGPWSGTSGGYSSPINPPPPSGSQSVLLVLDHQNGMFQFIPTVPGETYELALNIRLPDLNGGIPIFGNSVVGPGEFDITLNGNFSRYVVQNRTNWASLTLDFVATSTSSEIIQSDRGTDTLFVDDERVNLVPDQAPSFVLLMVALGGLGILGVRQGQNIGGLDSGCPGVSGRFGKK